LPAELRAQIGELAAAAGLNRYPDPVAGLLKSRLAATMNVPEGMELLLGNGSDELIQILALAVSRPGAVLMSVEPSFVMFKMVATFTGMRYIGVPLTASFDLDAQRMRAAIEAHQPALTFIAYPNNPTGNLFDAQAVHAVIEACPGLVVLDEAYHVFAQKTFLSELARYPNLLVMRTLSKLGLAGLRLGFALAAPDLAAKLNAALGPWAVSGPAIAIAERALADDAWIDATRTRLASAAEKLDQLLTEAGIEVVGGTSLFRLVRARRAHEIFRHLGTSGIIVRAFREQPTWLRFGIPSESSWDRVRSRLATCGRLAGKAMTS